MAIVMGDRYMDLLVMFLEREVCPLIEGALVLKLNPDGLHYIHSRIEALQEIGLVLLVLPNPLLKEIGLPLQRNQLHPIKRVLGIIDLRAPQCHQQPIRHELDVLAHQITVHPHEGTGKRVARELLLNRHRISDDPLDSVLAQLGPEETVEQTGEVAVEAFFTGDQLIGEGEARHYSNFIRIPANCDLTGGVIRKWVYEL